MFVLSSKNMSRLKKKLLLYFILISVVSISVSAEIILELGSPAFKNSFINGIEAELIRLLPQEEAERIHENLDRSNIFLPIADLQIRVILMLLVVSFSIIGAFFLFTKDIVAPMEGMVTATKRIADGDLSASVPVQSEDEIGQVAMLINEMSVNLQDLILQLRSEVERLKERIGIVSDRISNTLQRDQLTEALHQKKMSASEIRNLITAGDDMNGLLKDMLIDLSALQAFIRLYKVFEVKDQPPSATGAPNTPNLQNAKITDTTEN